MRVASPPIRYQCFMGVDMSRREELIAACKGVDEICWHIGADSLGYVSLEGLREAVGPGAGHCRACFTGDYPVAVLEETGKGVFEGGR